MTARNKLLTAPPYAVEKTLKGLGANLRTARLRRNLTIGEMAEKIGTGERAVADATPERDQEGQTLALSRERGRARPKTELSNDF